MMSGQLNPVIMVYPDAAYASVQDAYDALKAAGIIDIAENNSAFVIIPNPLNGTSYTEEDVNLYYESQVYLAGGKIVSFTPPTGEYERCTFNNMLYCIGEGSGATFINNYLTQNANRIAAVLTFGGEMDSSVSDGVALPAYLVNAADKAVSYYKNVNETDTQDGNTYVNSGYTEKKVIVAEGGDTFDASVIQNAWDELLGKTTRAPLACDVVTNTYDTSEWVLMSWPNYDAIGLSVTKGSYSYDGTDYDVYDYVPASYDGQTAVPLVVLLHGYTEDPLCPAATCGWADKAAEEGFILITPDYYNDLTASGAACGSVMQAVKEAIERYNIDTTRVYMTGFSMGGMTTAMTGYTNADVFAAIAPMSGMGDFTKEGLVVTQSDAEKYDLPTFFLAGTIDDKNTVMDESGTPVSITAMTGNDIYSKMAEFNEISFDAADYSINLFGHLADHSYSEEHQGYTYDIYQYYSSKYTNPTLEFVAVNGVAHACSNVYADLAWDFMKNFSRAADGTIVELK
jgi:poly(3-hydroxybutyrate) depolymerase